MRGFEFGLRERGTKIFFVMPASEDAKKALADLRENPMVPALDFIRALKRTRGRMLDARDGHGGNGHGNYQKTY
jgi:hypothetical protein